MSNEFNRRWVVAFTIIVLTVIFASDFLNWFLSLGLKASDWIAIGSLITALTAVGFTVYQARISRQHAIKSLRPIIEYHQTCGLGEAYIAIENVGQGAAEITRLVLRSDGPCFDFFKKDTREDIIGYTFLETRSSEDLGNHDVKIFEPPCWIGRKRSGNDVLTKLAW